LAVLIGLPSERPFQLKKDVLLANKRGCIIQRSAGSWSIIVYTGVDPVTGVKHQIWRTVKGTERDAKKEQTRLLHELDTGKLIRTTSATLSEYLERRLDDYARAAVTAKTFERYEEIVHHDLIPGLGKNKLERCALSISRGITPPP